MKRKKGFTLIELLVVIAIIALLVSILMPALAKARELAKRVQCSTQLNGIGKSMMMYANDYRDQFPRAMSQTGTNEFGQGVYADNSSTVATGTDPTHFAYRGFKSDWSDAPYATVGGSLYLMVRYTDLTPKMFVCPSSDDREMEFDICIDSAPDPTLIEGWDDLIDFMSGENLSYSYNDPWNRPLDASSSASLVLMADKSPAFDSSIFGVSTDIADATKPTPVEKVKGANSPSGDDYYWSDADAEGASGNSLNHAGAMQNVLFADTHVKKAETPCVGLADDNIFSYWTSQNATGTDQQLNLLLGGWGPDMFVGGANINDSYLGN